MRLRKMAITIMVLCAVVFLAVGCSSKATTTVKTQTVTAQKGSISVAITGTGNLALSRTESMAFEMAGYVEAVLVEEGESVKKGQELVKLDTSEWETQLKTLQKTLETAGRTLTTKQKALTTAQQLVTTKENAVATAQRQVTAKEFAVQQAELDVKTAQYNLDQIAVVKKAQDEIDNAEYAMQLATSVLGGALGGGLVGDITYWTQLKALAEAELIQAKADLQDILTGNGITLTTDVKLQIAKDQLAVTSSQMALDNAQQAVDDAKSAVADAQLAVEDARSSVADAQLDVEDAQTAVSDAQSALDDAKGLSPIITAPFDGFISSIKVAGGDEVYKGTIALVVADPNQFSAKILVTEDDIFSVKLGGDATVSLTALSDVTFPAKVTKISPTATVSSGVVNYSVTVNITSLIPITTTTTSQLPAASANRTMPSGMPSGNFTMPSGMPSGNVTAPAAASQTTTSATSTSSSTANVTLKDGLSATVEIISQQKTDIVKVLSKAITRVNQQSTVQVVKGTGTETRVVTTGLTDGTYTEVTSGLTEGEQVVIKTTTSSSSSSTSASKTTSSSAQQSLQGLSGGTQGGPPPGGF